MATYFLDSSALVKRHVTEPGHTWMQGLCRSGYPLLLYSHGLFRADELRRDEWAAVPEAPAEVPLPHVDHAARVHRLPRFPLDIPLDSGRILRPDGRVRL
jgi:hypothetical protein